MAVVARATGMLDELWFAGTATSRIILVRVSLAVGTTDCAGGIFATFAAELLASVRDEWTLLSEI